MEDLGLEVLDSDVCLLKHRELNILVVLYVDDLLIAIPTIALVNCIRDSLKAKFELKEIGEVKRFLGFDILRNRTIKKIFISQETYTRALLAKRDIQDYSPVAILWLAKIILPTEFKPVVT